ncbi:hypothetical protein H7K45_27865 [Mycobacterium yunnanensis]|uniref:Uncharacterized protein n=1 Tax=Mycobacterium yunnanensis TaxID=368477 RepID=A0A9X2Z7F3_9MYCO|nr:hypothetical protein [Mycobacterium yunnanensis]MCV7424368.1 hypothetical protein [Mycobacterium yunnanensis]
MTVDQELHQLAVKAAGQYPDSLLTAQGWTRQELVDAIHARLQTKYTDMRATGELVADDDGVIRPAKRSRRQRRRDHTTPAAQPARCPTPTKLAFRDQAHADDVVQHWGYEDAPVRPTRAYPCRCGSWHLTSQTAGQQDTGRHD